jgi:tRNA(Ile)-lysidine synthase
MTEQTHPLEQHIQHFFEQHRHIPIAVACSGGVDSMTLLALLNTLQLPLLALHVNYHLRGEESIKDQQLVEAFCAEKNIPIKIKSIFLAEQLAEKGGNLQDEARKIRYAFFEEIKQQHKATIALAHHADDQIETFFLQLARHAGTMGLACMLPEHNNFIRPLLTIKKEDIQEYAQQNNIPWREDASNATNHYRRNKLRNQFIPELQAAIPSLTESVLLLIKTFQENQLELTASIQPISQHIQHTKQLPFTHFDPLTDSQLIELLRQQNIPFGFLNELHKLRHAENGKRIIIKKRKLQIIRKKDNFYFL